MLCYESIVVCDQPDKNPSEFEAALRDAFTLQCAIIAASGPNNSTLYNQIQLYWRTECLKKTLLMEFSFLFLQKKGF